SIEFKVYPLRESSAARLAPMIKQLFEDRTKGRTAGGGSSSAGVQQPPETPVSIQPDEISNSLVSSASGDGQFLLADRIRMLDRQSTLIERVQIFPLTKAKAADVQKTLESLYSGKSSTGTGGGAPSGGGGGGAGAAGALISTAVDERINALI